MLERSLIQSTGFRNTGPAGARDGFEIAATVSVLVGDEGRSLDGFDVTVDGEHFGHEQNRLAIRDEVYTLDALREETEARWDLFEWASVRVSKPGGLEPGIHEVSVVARVRYSYFPPDEHVFPVGDRRLATLVLA